MITGQTLKDWGFTPSKHFGELIKRANELQSSGANDASIAAALRQRVADATPVTVPYRAAGEPYTVCLDAHTPEELDNKTKVLQHMDELMRVPTLVGGAVMPDACPSGSQPGTIPVGGVVSARNAIHPGFHSADICCSVAITVLKSGHDPKDVLDVLMDSTHFGPGGRRDVLPLPEFLLPKLAGNTFLSDLSGKALGDFASQGDGNHFAYVGRLESTGQITIVTHHGSRGLGAQLYKKGMRAAQFYTSRHAPDVPAHNAWIEADSREGTEYWAALQIVREWTRESHYAIHDLVVERLSDTIVQRFWNEHNFVFQKSDGLFYHGKGATPSWAGFSADDEGLTLIPLNMAEPILITAPRDNPAALGFSPHGAGRNLSRTAHTKAYGVFREGELKYLRDRGLDIRSYCGVPDFSELPSAYKDAEDIQHQINKYALARVEDRVLPYGSVMAGDWQRDAPWRKMKSTATEPQADSTEN